MMKHTRLLFLAVTLLLASATALAKQGGDEQVGSWRCLLIIEGVTLGAYGECWGIGNVNEVIEHEVMTPEGVKVVKIPGRPQFEDIVLKRALSAETDLWDWRQQVVDGSFGEARKNGSIIILDQTGVEIARWNFLNSWPSSISTSIGGGEEVTLVVEYIERVN